MGQIAEDMIDGTCCSLCGCYFIKKNKKQELELFTHGYPVACNDCHDDNCSQEKQSKDAKTA